jgi:predicted dehydrogenase
VIRIGLIGTGYWGPNVATSFKATGRAQLAWICDTNASALAAFSQRHPDARTTTNFRDVLADQTVDAVAIVTPTETHYPLAKAALEAGKHVLVEKPMSTNPEHVEALIALSDASRRVLMVGHVFQYNATLRALKDLISAGDLGSVNYLNLVRTNLGPVRTDVNALWDLASHDAYIMIDLLGSAPETVSAFGRAYLNPSVEDVVFATFTFAGGAVAHVHASWLDPRKVRQITVVGSRKMALWDDLNLEEPIRVYDKRVDMPRPGSLEGSYQEHKTLVVDGGTTAVPVAQNRPLQAECEHFLTCVEGGTTPLSDGRNALAAVRVLRAAHESMRRGGAVVKVA